MQLSNIKQKRFSMSPGALKLVLIVTSVMALACNRQNFALEPASNEFGQKTDYNTQVDVLFVVDNSGSMSVHQNYLATQTHLFIDSLDLRPS